MKKKKSKNKTSKKDKILITVFSVIIALSLCCVGVVALLNYRPMLEEPQEEGKDNILDEEITTPTEIKDRCVHFLVTGIDYTDASHGARGKLTDVIMLVSYDIANGEVNVLQVPRDTYIGDQYSTGKINAIYSSPHDGGIEGLATQLNKMFKIPIDHYVTINMDGFIHVVDAIGGVDVEVPITFTLEGVTLEAGKQHLDGRQAEKLVRERHSYVNADLGRIQTQQAFMKAVIQKCMAMGKKKMLPLAPTLAKEITTDLSLGQILGFYDKFSALTAENIHFYTAPNTGDKIDGQWLLWLKKSEVADLLNEKFRPYSDPVPADQLSIIEF